MRLANSSGRMAPGGVIRPARSLRVEWVCGASRQYDSIFRPRIWHWVTWLVQRRVMECKDFGGSLCVMLSSALGMMGSVACVVWRWVMETARMLYWGSPFQHRSQARAASRSHPQTPASLLGILRFAWIRETSTWGLQHASKQWRNKNFDFASRHYRSASSMGGRMHGGWLR